MTVYISYMLGYDERSEAYGKRIDMIEGTGMAERERAGTKQYRLISKGDEEKEVAQLTRSRNLNCLLQYYVQLTTIYKSNDKDMKIKRGEK